MAIRTPEPPSSIPLAIAIVAIASLLVWLLKPKASDGADEIDEFLRSSATALSGKAIPVPPGDRSLAFLTPVVKDVAALRARLGGSNFEEAMKKRSEGLLDQRATELMNRIISDPHIQSLQLAALGEARFKAGSIVCAGKHVLCRRVFKSREKDEDEGFHRIVANFAPEQGQGNGSVLLMEHTNRQRKYVIGSLRVGPESFLMRQVSENVFALTTQRKVAADREISDVAASAVPPANVPSPPLAGKPAVSAPTDTVFDTGLKSCPNPAQRQDVTILVGVTPRAHQEALKVGKYVPTLVQLAWLDANRSFENSDINGNIVKPTIVQVNYQEVGGERFEADIQEIQKPAGKLSGFRKNRLEARADIGVLVVHEDNPGRCGRAAGIRVTKDKAYVVVNWQCLVEYQSFIHEVGHLVGAWHDPKSQEDGDVPNPAFAQGYITTGAQAMATIMANTRFCLPCGREIAWSNPDKFTDDGQVLGTLNEYFNACIWRQRLSDVASFDGG